jgi:nitroimidazol reductase NimA-like FMN-containing flavoprotein (pyridoxamine 5'-phosphate oxidase superfamily)
MACSHGIIPMSYTYLYHTAIYLLYFNRGREPVMIRKTDLIFMLVILGVGLLIVLYLLREI